MELSEAFYAGLSLVDTKDLIKASTNKEAFVELYDVVVNNFKGPGVLDGQGNATKTKASAAITVKEGQSPNIKLYNDMAAAMSAVIGTRGIRSGIPQAVYLTGNKWNEDVEQFQLDVKQGFGMKLHSKSLFNIQLKLFYIFIPFISCQIHSLWYSRSYTSCPYNC